MNFTPFYGTPENEDSPLLENQGRIQEMRVISARPWRMGWMLFHQSENKPESRKIPTHVDDGTSPCRRRGDFGLNCGHVELPKTFLQETHTEAERPRPALHLGLSKDIRVCELVPHTLPVPAPPLLPVHLKAVARLPLLAPSLQQNHPPVSSRHLRQ